MIFKTLLLIAVIFLQVNGQQKFSEIGNLKLVSGEEIINCKIGYRTFGTLNSDKSNLILFPAWFGGKSEHLQNQIGEGKPLDSTLYFIVAVDAIGNGVSSSPSNSEEQPRDKFPLFTIKDLVNSQKALLEKEFHAEHIYAVYGGSMGGMQVFQWVVSYPGFMDKAVSYVGSPQLTSSDIIFWQAQLSMIEACLSCGCNNEELAKAVSLMQSFAIQTTAYKTRTILRDTVSSYIDMVSNNFNKTFIPENWASQLRGMLSHDITLNFNNSLEEAAGEVKAELLIITAKQDQIVNPSPAVEFAEYAGAELIIIDNDCGHLAPGCDYENFVKAVREFLN